MDHYKFKLKGTGSMEIYLGINFFHDRCGAFYMTSRMNVEKMCATVEQWFDHVPKLGVTSLIEKNDHLELGNTLEFFALDDITKYQSPTSALQWVVSIGRFGIMTSVVSLS